MSARTTLRKFAESDPLFRRACELAGEEPTKRQASRWFQRRGSAWAKRDEAARELAAELTPILGR